MFFQSWSDLLNMGGYGFYVWLSYGLSVLLIMALVIQSAYKKCSKKEKRYESKT